MVSQRTDPAVEDVAFLEPEAELLDLQERRLDQLLDVEGHLAVVPKIDRMMVHVVVVSVVVGLVGLDAWKFGMEDGLADSPHLCQEGGDLDQPSVVE